MSDAKELVVLDVRTPAEFAEVHVEGASNIDFYGSDFVAQINALDKNKVYRVYCRSGNRSGQTEQLMRNLGFSDVENIGSVEEAAHYLKRNCV